jgi:Flp pilus assembly protein TadD
MGRHLHHYFRLAVATVALLGNAAFAATQSGSIVSLQGVGEVRPAQTTDWKKAAVRQGLFGGDFVRTGDLSQMAILFADQTQVRLNQNSQLQIKSVADGPSGQTAVRLNAGRAWSQAKPQTFIGGLAASFRTAFRLNMETPSATMSIRGTDWEVEVAPNGRTQLVVLSGVVDMGNEQGSVQVARGEAAVAEVGKAPVKIVLTNPAERVQWVTAFQPEPARVVAAAGKEATTAELEAAKLIGDGRWAEARQALETQPAHWVRDLLLADLRVVEGRLAEAIALANAAAAPPAPVFARARQAEYLVMADRENDARRLLAEAISRDRKSPDVWVAEGRRARFAGEAARAREAYGQAAQIAPDDERGWKGLGAVAAEREEVAPARAHLGRALRIAPKDATALGELGTLETLADRYPEAGRAFDAALDAKPDDYVALTGRGVMKLKQGEADAALEDFLKAGLMEPRYARARLYTGIAYYQLGRFDRAREEFAKAAELDPKDPLPHLYAGMAHTDHFEVAQAVASARAALERMPNLKSLNQVANNQKGVANVGNALSFWGMRDWALSYAHNGEYPFWGGSHLFLADLYDSKFAKNSELFQGFLADPTVFGASTRFQSLIHRPGHYQALTLVAGRDKEVNEIVPRVTLNGYSNSVTPFAYFFEADNMQGKSRSGTSFNYEDDTTSVTAAAGWQPRHDLRFFAFYNRDNTDSKYSGGDTQALSFNSPTSDLSAGGSWFISPTFMLQVRAGESRIEGTQKWLWPAVPARFDDKEISRDAQVGLRYRHGDAWELAGGIETAESPEDSRWAVRLAPGAAPFWDDAAKLSERTALGWASGRYFFSPTSQLQFDLVYTDYVKRNVGDLLMPPAVNYRKIDLEYARRDKVNGRFGFVFSPVDGHRLRYAWQDWIRPSNPGGLAPAATAGIPLDETLLRFGGRQQRHVLRWETEWAQRLYTEVTLDGRRARNLDTYDLSLAENFSNLARIRQKSLTEITDFYAGASIAETASANLATRAEVDQLRFAANAILTEQLSSSASFTLTRSELEYSGISPYYLPKQMARFGLTWVSPSRVRLAFEAQWRSRAWTFATLETMAAPRGAYWNGAASVSWESTDKRYGLAAFAKDLFSPHGSAYYGIAANVRF